MEESEKRRERLKAMRVEAAQGDISNDVCNFTQSHGLSNPLIETSTAHQELCTPQRFDYYTDPMSAFSGNKRGKFNTNISQKHFTPPRPQNTGASPQALTSQINYSAEQEMYQSQEPVSSPIEMTRPFSMQPGTPRSAWNGSDHISGDFFPSNSPRGNFQNPASSGGQGGSPTSNSGQGRGHWFSNSPDPNSGHGGLPGLGQEGGPSFNSEQGREYWSNNCSNPGSGFGGSPGFGQRGRATYNSGQGRGYWSKNSPSPFSGRGDSPGFGHRGRPSFSSGHGRGNWFRNNPIHDSRCGDSPVPNSGRGSGRWSGNSTSPGTGWSGGRGRGGRGRGSRDNVSAELRPDLYYNKSMVEDPWKFLRPVIWKIEDSPKKGFDSMKSWLPKSISMQKAKATEASTDHKSQPSLAEYLAASFNEAVNNEDINDESIV